MSERNGRVGHEVHDGAIGNADVTGRVQTRGGADHARRLSWQCSVVAVAEMVVAGNATTFLVAVTGVTTTAPRPVVYRVSVVAIAVADYTAPSGRLTLGSRGSSGTVTSPTLTDTVLERGETLVATLTGASVTARR